MSLTALPRIEQSVNEEADFQSKRLVSEREIGSTLFELIPPPEIDVHRGIS